MRTLIFLTAISTTLACSGDKSDTADSGEAAFLPMEGDWTWSNTSYISDDCALEARYPTDTVEAIVWTLTLTDDGFELAAVTGDPLSCSLSGMDSTCDVTLVSEAKEWPEGSDQTGDPDVITTTESSFVGSFVDANSSTGTVTANATCEGADCEAYAAALGASSTCTTVFAGDFTMGM